MIGCVSKWFRNFGFADVSDDLVIGAYPLDADDVKMLQWIRVGRVLNLVEDEEYGPGEREQVVAALAAAGIEEHRLPMIDYGGIQADALDTAVQDVIDSLDSGVRSYVHCRAGWQRSAAVAAAVVAVREGIDIDEALASVRAHKPSANPLPHQREDLRLWWEGRDDRRTGRGQ
jgi:protein-tyrosine phosphatase